MDEIFRLKAGFHFANAVFDRSWREVEQFGNFLGRMPLDQQLNDAVIDQVGFQFLMLRNSEAPFCKADAPLRRSIGLLRDDLDDPFPEKPKGMHWRTYDMLAERGEALDEQAERAGLAMFGRLLQSYS